MADVTIDQAAFGKRLKLLYDSWKANKTGLWEGADALGVIVGSTSEDLRYLKSISLHLWLFGYELPDTVLLFTQQQLHVLTSQKKANLLQPLADAARDAAGVELLLHVKAKGDDGGGAMDAMISAAGAGPLGQLPKDQHQGAVAALWAQKVASAAGGGGGGGLALVDAAAGFADLFGVKDDTEVLNVKKAAFLATKVMAHVVEQIEEIIDQEKKVKHSKLSELVEGVATEPTRINVRLKAENCDIAYPPVVQSGGEFDLKLSAASTDSVMAQEGVVLVALGTRYSSYCANVARTYIVDGSKQQEGEYKALLAAHAAALGALKEGTPACDVHAAAVKALEGSEHPHLAQHLARNVGFGMGLEFRESHAQLSAKNGAPLKAGQVFNVVIGLSGLSDPSIKDAALQNYALQVADTAAVKPGGAAPEVMTAGAPREFDKISYTLKEEGESEEERRPEAFDDVTNGLAGKKLRSDDPNYKSADQIRREKQEELLRQKNAETLKRLTAQAKGGDAAGGAAGGRVISQIQAYRGVADVPQHRELRIAVDATAETVLLPLYGVLVPFHITTLKSIGVNQDNEHAYIRVSFNTGGAYEPAQRFPELVFLKDLTFRTSDARHAAKVVQEVKLLRSTVLSRDKERAERATLVTQEKLIRGKRVYRLPDLWVRPSLGGRGRKQPGALEAHANGFRYMNPKGEGVDVMFRNIRHAFFQPAENEMVTILHFHLHNPIMMGNKKTKDVQFYAEVMDVVQTLDGGRRALHDPDELEEEQRERERRNKINSDFQQFVKRVQEMWERDMPDLNLEFDIPFRELAFEGVPHRSTVTVMPTVNCIVELTEMPFTVVSLQDIEVVNLERVGFNLKNFDMAIVFKDFSRDVMRIDAIPTRKLDTIRDWLVSVKIKYFESKLNLAWKPILKSIQEDPEGFVEQGGWDFLNMDKSDSEDEDEASSEGFQPSASEEEDDDSSDYSSGDEDLTDEDSDGGEGGGSGSGEGEEDEGLSWDELEEEARREDRKRDMEDGGEEDERPRKRKAGGGGGGGGGGRR